MGTLIGSGIFLVPHEMMRATGSSGLVYLAWIVGGLLSLFGAMTYAELSTMLPYTGGEYVYLRRAYGDMTAFLYMWTWFAVAKPASIASVTTGLARTLAIFPALRWLDGTAFHIGLAVTWAQIFAIGMTWLMTGLNYLGIKKAGDFQLIFTWLKGVLILVIAGFCFASSVGNWSNFGTVFPGATGGFGGFMVALIAALWAYDGWNDLTMVSGEVQNPQRSLPIALIAGLGIVGVLYMATNAAIQYILPAATIAAEPRPAVAALPGSDRAVGRGAGFRCDGAEHICNSERHNHVGCAGAVCGGAGWAVLPAHGGHSSEVPEPVDFADCAGSADDGAAAGRRAISAAVRAGDFCRVAFLHDYGDDDLLLPAGGSRRRRRIACGAIRWFRRCLSSLRRCFFTTRMRRT